MACPNPPQWLQTNSGDFVDLDSWVYWSSSTVANPSPAAWSFSFGNGVQDGHTQPLEFQAWAVRPGDVPNNVMPEPNSLTLLMLAFGAATLAAGRRRC